MNASAGLRFTLRRAGAVLAAMLALAAVAFAAAVSWGEQSISLWNLSTPESTDAVIFWSLRLPRAALAALVGASLGASGCALQAVMRNPLADPFVLGVSGGAALGATLAMAMGWGAVGVGAAAWLSFSAVPLMALVGALAATGLVLGLGRVGGRSPYATLLAGVIFNAFALALITFVKVLLAPDRLGEILFWLAGTLGYERAGTLGVAGVLQAIALGTLWAQSARLNVMLLGDDDAASLGVQVHRTRLILLVAVSFSVAVSVSLSGLVGFVGLVVPHLLRLLLGPDQRLLIPASALGGAAFLMVADLAARLLFPLFHTEPPVGVVTSILGGAFFLGLLYRARRYAFG